MNGPETILGYAQYEGDSYPFVYEKGILNLLPGSEVEWSKQKSKLLESFMEISKFQVRHEWMSNEYIKGITNKGKKVVFITKGVGSNNNGFIQYAIQVIYQYSTDSLNGDLINGLIITADEIDYFFNPGRVFNSEIIFSKDNRVQEIHVRSGIEENSTINCGSYDYEDILIKVEVSAYSTLKARSENPLSAQSQMCFEFNKAIELDKALEIIYQQESFLRYICYRKNININTVKVFSRNDLGLRRTEGEIYIISEEFLETDKNKNKHIITFEFLQEKIIHLFQEIADGKVYSEHICSSMEKRKSYNIARIILIFAAFEREYNNIFASKPIRSQEYFDIKEKVLNLLEDLKKTYTNKKAKKYIKGFKKIIDTSDNNLSERIKNAMINNLDILRVFLKYNYQEDDDLLINEIAQRMNIMRNNMAHGNLDLEIEPIHLSDFKILEILIYTMRLNSLSIDTKSIQKAICQLLGMNIHIPDESWASQQNFN